MFFRIIEPYYKKMSKKKLDKEYEIKECFICLEVHNDKEETTMPLKEQKHYIKQCKCNGHIHCKCLDIWFEQNQKCPICRQTMSKNSETICKLFNYSQYLAIMYLFYQHNFVYIKKILLVMIFFYFTSEFYLEIIYSSYYNRFNRHSKYHNINFEKYRFYGDTSPDINYIVHLNNSKFC